MTPGKVGESRARQLELLCLQRERDPHKVKSLPATRWYTGGRAEDALTCACDSRVRHSAASNFKLPAVGGWQQSVLGTQAGSGKACHVPPQLGTVVTTYWGLTRSQKVTSTFDSGARLILPTFHKEGAVRGAEGPEASPCCPTWQWRGWSWNPGFRLQS